MKTMANRPQQHTQHRPQQHHCADTTTTTVVVVGVERDPSDGALEVTDVGMQVEREHRSRQEQPAGEVAGVALGTCLFLCLGNLCGSQPADTADPPQADDQ